MKFPSLPVSSRPVTSPGAREGGVFKLGKTCPAGLGLLLTFAAALPGPAQEQPSGSFTADFEAPAYQPGNIHGQQGWAVDQGAALVVPGAGLWGSAGLSVSPSSLFSQVRLSLERTASSAPVLYFDAWVRFPSAPWLVFDETLDLEGARVGLFHTSAFSDESEWYVFHGDKAGGGYWLGTGIQPEIQLDSGFTADWNRLTVRMDSMTQTWTVWVDELLLGSDLGMQFPSEPDFAHFFVLGDPLQPVLVDNVTVTSANPLPPVPEVVIPGGSVAAEARSDKADSDADGMPDTWELAQGLDPTDGSDGILDRDGDGLSSLDEFLLGTGESVRDARRMVVSEGAAVFNRFDGVSSRRISKGQ
jgi:hypothetical protein